MGKFNLETKIKAVKDVLEEGMSQGAVAESLSTRKNIIQRWIARYEKFGIPFYTLHFNCYGEML